MSNQDNATTATETTDVQMPAVATTGAVQPVLTAEQKAEHFLTIKANFNSKVDVVETAFHFRKTVDEATKIETKRASVLLPLPTPSVEGLIDIIQNGGKGLDLLIEAAQGIVIEQAREYINNNEDVTSLNFPFAMLDWNTIANLPKADRRGGGISKEVWDEFAKDYILVMPALINKSSEAVTMATKIFLTKFANVKTNKAIISKLKDYLAIYINNTARGEEFVEAVEWLNKKADVLIATGEENLLNAL
jgi:hypothetical protein